MKKIINKYKLQFKEAWKQLKTPGERIKQVPNILTASRLLAPFLIIPSVATGNFVLAGISTLVFSATDMVDGFLARNLKLTSDLGKDLDAFADKIFVATLISSLLFINLNYLIPLILEASISGINIYKKIKDKNPESHMIGKIKMTSLYFLIASGFINMYIKIPQTLINTLYIGTVGLQGLTIYDYSKENKKINSDKNSQDVSKNQNIEHKNGDEKEKTNTEKKLEQYKSYKRILEEQQNLHQVEINQKTKTYKKRK